MRAVLRYLKSFVIIYAFLLVGNAAVELVQLPISGSIIGMILLTVCLQYGFLTPDSVEPAGGTLLRYMALFFVPPGVGLVLYFDLLRDEWMAIVLASLVSTVAVLVTVAYTQQRLEADG